MNAATITLDVAGAKVTIPSVTLAKLWLAQIQQQSAVSSSLQKPPRIGQPWIEQGGIYAGVARGCDGAADHHVVVCEAKQDNIAWKDAMEWAAGLEAAGDFSLPTRAEQALLFANVPELFEKEWYWSSEAHKDPASAWCQYFCNGYQGYGLKRYRLGARAVRRIPIE